jgi:transposase-like protein
MKKGDVTCNQCGAGFRRLELASAPATKGEYHCPACGEILEKFDGNAFVAYRLTIQPSIKGMRDCGTAPLPRKNEGGPLPAT